MKVGILEARDDLFIQDLVSQLVGEEVEYLSFGEDISQLANRYQVVVDRLSYRFPYLREALKIMAMKGTYVINNPFAANESNKFLDYEVCKRLGIPTPKTILLPDVSVEEEIGGIVKSPDWEKIALDLGLPCVIKPYNGYGWFDVFVVTSLDEMKKVYDSTRSSYVLLAQQYIDYKDYYRVYCVNKKELLLIKWIPKPLGAGEYLLTDQNNLNTKKDMISELTIKLNTVLDRDINATEWCLDKDGKPWVIDTYNEVPDMPKSSLPEEHYRWIVEKFAACVKEKLRGGVRNKNVFDCPA